VITERTAPSLPREERAGYAGGTRTNGGRSSRPGQSVPRQPVPRPEEQRATVPVQREEDRGDRH
jgi:hypothetical protein